MDGKPKPQFSVKEITVNKSDYEFNVYADTPSGKETVVEFTANQAGEFIYYCNQPGHRENGHWGTFKVIE